MPTAVARILELAARHGLVCYDPQTRRVHPPEGALRLVACDGSELTDPAVADIDRQLRRIDAANWYAWLERPEGTYVQVGLGPNAGAPDGRYCLEYRDGSAERHVRVVTRGPSAAMSMPDASMATWPCGSQG